MDSPRLRPRFPSPLRTVRRSRTLTQGQLADLLEVSIGMYCRIEAGTVVPPPEVQTRIAAILNAPIAMLWPSLAPRALEAVASPPAEIDHEVR